MKNQVEIPSLDEVHQEFSQLFRTVNNSLHTRCEAAFKPIIQSIAKDIKEYITDEEFKRHDSEVLATTLLWQYLTCMILARRSMQINRECKKDPQRKEGFELLLHVMNQERAVKELSSMTKLYSELICAKYFKEASQTDVPTPKLLN